MKSILATKRGISRGYDDQGRAYGMTELKAGPCVVAQIRTTQKNGYQAIQLGFGSKIGKRTNKADNNKEDKLGGETLPLFLREIGIEDDDLSLKIGQEVRVESIFKVGDKVMATGISKGKGFAGVVKRHGFKGGPRTHGQSDRERAPGSIASGTTPGRVFKGKRMAGRMGSQRKTVRNLTVLKIDPENNLIYLSGPVPGAPGALITLIKN